MYELKYVRMLLDGLHPSLYPLLVLLAVWGLLCGLRAWFPAQWERYANIPIGGGLTLNSEVTRIQLVVRKVWQALPGVAVGAVLVLLSGSTDPVQLLALASPLWHELFKALPGPYGTKRE